MCPLSQWPSYYCVLHLVYIVGMAFIASNHPFWGSLLLEVSMGSICHVANPSIVNHRKKYVTYLSIGVFIWLCCTELFCVYLILNWLVVMQFHFLLPTTSLHAVNPCCQDHHSQCMQCIAWVHSCILPWPYSAVGYMVKFPNWIPYSFLTFPDFLSSVMRASTLSHCVNLNLQFVQQFVEAFFIDNFL